MRRLIVCFGLVLLCALAINAQSEKVFNLSEFNPVGNGVADDGPAFQQALDALHQAGGGKLLIPAGSYRISTPVAKDFSAVPGAKVTFQGVPSSKMPAPVTASGNELAEGLALASDIIPATGVDKTAFTIRNLDTFLIEHVGFSGSPLSETDAFITLYFIDIGKATIRHCEFYGVSTFGFQADSGGGNIVRAVRSELSIELSSFLGSTGNSGVYAALVENIEWKKFSISNSIFLDYGLRDFFSKTGLGAPLSWINLGNAAEPTPDSPRREVIVRDVFLDEGGWVGISALPYRYTPFNTLPDLIYISGLKMNVSNLATTGHLLYYGRNLLIENSHYGWSHNATSALDINRFENVILDKLTCIAHANRIVADDQTHRLTVINSVYDELASLAGTTTVLETTPEDDPVQYVRSQFVNALGRQPDPAAHFYWSDLLIKCGNDNGCLNETRSAMSEYLGDGPQENFALAGTVVDENGNPMSGVTINLTGSQPAKMVTDAQGNFRFSGLPTSGIYTVAVDKRHCTFATANKTFTHPAGDVLATFEGRLNRHSIGGRITRQDGVGISDVTVQLSESPTTTATTDAEGFYSFPDLAAGGKYTVVPVLDDFAFTPANKTFEDLSEDRVINFGGKLMIFALTATATDENGDPISDANIRVTGSQSTTATTDSEGSFQMEGLPTNGSYTVTIEKRHYTFVTTSKNVSNPLDHVNVVFSGRLNRHKITGRLTRIDGAGMSGVAVQLAQSPSSTVMTDANGFYTFTELPAGESYTVIPLMTDFVFAPANLTFDDLGANASANFVGKLQPVLMMSDGSEFAVAFDSVSFAMQSFSIFSSLGLSNDGFMRMTIFAKNLEPVSSPLQISVVGTDDEGQAHALDVEFMGQVPGLSGLKQLNIKVPTKTLGGKCVQLSLTVAEVTSNQGRICIANQ